MNELAPRCTVDRCRPSSLCLKTVTRRIYYPGDRAVIPQPGRRTVSYSLLLCICPVGVLNWSLRSGTVDSEFLGKLPIGITLLLDNARIHHATTSLRSLGLPTIAELALAKSITLKHAPPCTPHLNPVEYCFNTVRHFLRSQEAWTEAKLVEPMKNILMSGSFSKAATTKLFTSVIWGTAEPGTRARNVMHS